MEKNDALLNNKKILGPEFSQLVLQKVSVCVTTAERRQNFSSLFIYF